MTPAELAARILQTQPRLGATRFVAIDGSAGSGKTTLARELAEELGDAATVIHLDDLYPGWDGLDDCWQFLEQWVLAPLRNDTEGRARHYDWSAGRFGDNWYAVPATSVLIVEGVGSGRRAAADELSLLVWVDAPDDVRWRRLIDRDGADSSPQLRRWQAAEQRHFARERTRQRADIVLGARSTDDGSRRCPVPATLPDRAKEWLDGKAFVTVADVYESGQPHTSVVWVMRDGDDLLFSTTKDREKYRNLSERPKVSALVINPENPYCYLEVRGSVTITEQGGRELIDDLMEKYHGQRPYPWDQEGAVRVILRLTPDKVVFSE